MKFLDKTHRRPNHVRELRHAANLSLEQLSWRSGVPLSTLSEIERNREAVRTKYLVALADALAVTVDDLIRS